MSYEVMHPLQPYWNLAAAPLQTQALQQALHYGLFDVLRQPATAAQLARRLALNPRAVQLWLELLWSMQLLARQAGETPQTWQYSSAPSALDYFVSGAALNNVAAWQYRVAVLAAMAGHWPDLLRHGPQAGGPGAARGTWAQAAREQISQEQRAVSVPTVRRLLQTLPALPAQGRFLDLGGGPGHVAIALADLLPQWQGVVCDAPETVAVAAEHIEQAALGERVQVLGCDLNQDAFGQGYDLIWCSSVLHFLQDPAAAVNAMAHALAPGGRLLLAHAEWPDDAGLAARVLPFYGSLLLRGHYLPRPGEIERLMRGAGLQPVQALGRCEFPLAPVWIYAGQQP